MFIVPFFIRTPLQSLCAWKLIPVAMFLANRGKTFYTLSDGENPDEWLDQNGFIQKSRWKEGEFLYVEIDAAKTNCKDFYSFEQVTAVQSKGMEECWKTFFCMKTQEENDPSLKSWNELFEPEVLATLQKIKARML